jgi:hypothetical protein
MLELLQLERQRARSETKLGTVHGDSRCQPHVPADDGFDLGHGRCGQLVQAGGQVSSRIS